ncbi:vegetative cell wall protein gp1 [Zea mays]|uniref:vegetative cell wall protein gp1 n=1 Tax=Zea mays TaxID=4577 RepID=UPI0004DEBE6C|nr:vegetative cell wall protein gp1-like [Zea mays]|eukprot:XP_008663094.1 vegetative cell wall protein gp1-like [Zea mays]
MAPPHSQPPSSAQQPSAQLLPSAAMASSPSSRPLLSTASCSREPSSKLPRRSSSTPPCSSSTQVGALSLAVLSVAPLLAVPLTLAHRRPGKLPHGARLPVPWCPVVAPFFPLWLRSSAPSMAPPAPSSTRCRCSTNAQLHFSHGRGLLFPAPCAASPSPKSLRPHSSGSPAPFPAPPLFSTKQQQLAPPSLAAQPLGETPLFLQPRHLPWLPHC